jgi:hypothetical protein
VDRFVEQGHQEEASAAGLVDPIEREGLRDWDEEGIMPEKEED